MLCAKLDGVDIAGTVTGWCRAGCLSPGEETLVRALSVCARFGRWFFKVLLLGLQVRVRFPAARFSGQKIASNMIRVGKTRHDL